MTTPANIHYSELSLAVLDRLFPGPVTPAEAVTLGHQQRTILNLMIGGGWLTLAEIADVTGFPEASISAQLRHLRKPRFGGFTVLKRRRAAGLWEYEVANAM